MAHESFIIPQPTSKDLERFWKLVDKNGPTQHHCPELGPCWIYIGNRLSRGGYGTFWLQKRETTMHRMSLAIHLGYSPDPNLVILHKCDYRICCNPAHLVQSSQYENLQDAVQKGRMASGDRNAMRARPEIVPKGKRHYAAKLTEEIVISAREEYKLGQVSSRTLGSRYGVSYQVMHEALCGKSWKHLPGAIETSHKPFGGWRGGKRKPLSTTE